MKLRRKLRVLAITVGAVAALTAIAASPAMAEKVATKFNASTATLSGTNLTVKKNGGEAKTCELKSTAGKANEGSGTLEVWTVPLSFSLDTRLQCTGGTTLAISLFAAKGQYDTVTGAYSLKVTWAGNARGYLTPYASASYWGGYLNKEVAPSWINGSGATASKIVFNETYLGKLEPALTADITLSGTITATTSTGGLLTLSH